MRYGTVISRLCQTPQPHAHTTPHYTAPHRSHENMESTKKFTRKEISEKDPKKGTWFVIHNVVYDVTQFMDEHPGGHEVLVNVAGKDASEDFVDVGHSFDAKELMKKYAVGEVVEEDRLEVPKQSSGWDVSEATTEEGGFISSWKFPLVMGLLITLLYKYLFG